MNFKNIFLAGPISNIQNWNKPAFAEAAELIRSLGYSVFNPTAPGEEYPEYNEQDHRPIHIRRDLLELTLCDCVAVLPGWMNSFARIEVEIAKNLDLPIFYLQERVCKKGFGKELC